MRTHTKRPKVPGRGGWTRPWPYVTTRHHVSKWVAGFLDKTGDVSCFMQSPLLPKLDSIVLDWTLILSKIPPSSSTLLCRDLEPIDVDNVWWKRKHNSNNMQLISKVIGDLVEVSKYWISCKFQVAYWCNIQTRKRNIIGLTVLFSYVSVFLQLSIGEFLVRYISILRPKIHDLLHKSHHSKGGNEQRKIRNENKKQLNWN